MLRFVSDFLGNFRDLACPGSSLYLVALFLAHVCQCPVPPAGHQGSTTRSSSPTLKAFVLNQTFQCFLIRGFAGKPFLNKIKRHIVEDVQVYHLQWLYLQLVLLVLLGKTPFEAEMPGTKDLAQHSDMNGPGTHPRRKPYGSKDHLTGPCIIPTLHTFHLAKETWVFTQLRMVYLSHDQMSTANFGAAAVAPMNLVPCN